MAKTPHEIKSVAEKINEKVRAGKTESQSSLEKQKQWLPVRHSVYIKNPKWEKKHKEMIAAVQKATDKFEKEKATQFKTIAALEVDKTKLTQQMQSVRQLSENLEMTKTQVEEKIKHLSNYRRITTNKGIGSEM